MTVQAQAARSNAPTPRFEMNKMKVLVADDNPQALDILAQVLLGFSVSQSTQCRTAPEASEILARDIFDLAIVDGEMPGQDGFDLVHGLRSQPDGPNFTMPVVIVSGFTPRAKVERARDAGANLIITKPIVPRVLLGRIEYLASNPRPFVTTATYCGPDRRFHKAPLPPGITDRRSESIKLLAQPERAMSQDEIDSIFS